MSKYKIVASKSQKKYTLIISADSEIEAKEKLHKDGYSILTIHPTEEDSEIIGNKFLFQIENNGEIKNWIIIGIDIFKVYIKLKDELGYNIIFLYPEWDEAHNSAEKKQKIMDQLIYGYEMQKKTLKLKEQKQKAEESFYLKKQLDDTYKLIEKVVQKIEHIIHEKENYTASSETFEKLEKVYESLIHIKGSTNLSKLKEIGELALLKVGQIELQSLEKKKDLASRELVKNTNELLKKIGSKEQFIEHDKDFKRIFQEFFAPIKDVFSFREFSKEKKREKKSKSFLDTESYSFLKTLLLLEKYKEKLDSNTQEMKDHKLLFLNPFMHSEFKEKHLLKRKVIQQNISILKAKKTGSLGSYTYMKKGYRKILEWVFSFLFFLKDLFFFWICLYIFLFLFSIFSSHNNLNILQLHTDNILSFLAFFAIFIILSLSKNVFLFLINIVFFTFLSIFCVVNF